MTGKEIGAFLLITLSIAWFIFYQKKKPEPPTPETKKPEKETGKSEPPEPIEPPESNPAPLPSLKNFAINLNYVKETWPIILAIILLMLYLIFG